MLLGDVRKPNYFAFCLWGGGGGGEQFIVYFHGNSLARSLPKTLRSWNSANFNQLVFLNCKLSLDFQTIIVHPKTKQFSTISKTQLLKSHRYFNSLKEMGTLFYQTYNNRSTPSNIIHITQIVVERSKFFPDRMHCSVEIGFSSVTCLK